MGSGKLRPIGNIIATRTANASLDELKVRLIRQALKDGALPSALAEVFGVGTETVRRIGRRESWAWVKDEIVEAGPEALSERLPLPPKTQETEDAAKASLARLLAMQQEPSKDG